MPNPSLYKISSCTIQPIAGEDKGIYAFPKGISPKVKLSARLKFELAYYDVTVHHVRYHTIETPLQKIGIFFTS